MSYQVTARKWRPMVFDDVVGQSHVTNTLRNAIATKRVAHAYIFSGTRGCGKTTTARIFARALNCLHPDHENPDNTCDICTAIVEGRSLDVIEIDGASNRGVEEIRNLRESVRYTPTQGTFKVYIIDEVHMLTKEAFNALLKTLEEPPAHVVFIFATTEVHRLPTTILSRCQRFDFRRIAIDEISERLRYIAAEEQVTIEPEALAVIARRADGSMRDGQSIFDQVRSFCGNAITAAELLKAFNVVDQELYFRITAAFKLHDTKATIELVDELMRNGYDLREFVGGLIEHLRNLLVARATGSAQLVEVSEQYRARYTTEAALFAEADLLRLMKISTDLDSVFRWAPQPRFRVEAALLQMARMENAIHLQQLIEQIDELKKKLLEGRTSAPAALPIRNAAPGSAPRAEVRITGEVHAGYLRTPAAVRYTSSSAATADPRTALPDQPRATDFSSTSATIIPFADAALRTATIEMDTLRSRWGDFVGDVLKKRIALGTTLRESHILDARNGSLRIVCPDDFHHATLKRHREFLAEAFAEFYGTRMSFEALLPGEAPEPARHEPSSGTGGAVRESRPAPAPIPASSGTPADHPLIEVLKREFGAERMGEA